LGNVTGSGKIGIQDSVEIIMYLANLKSVIKTDERAFEAALVLNQSQRNRKPALGDAVEILKAVANLHCKLICEGNDDCCAKCGYGNICDCDIDDLPCIDCSKVVCGCV
jgi:hypothetical protein